MDRDKRVNATHRRNRLLGIVPALATLGAIAVIAAALLVRGGAGATAQPRTGDVIDGFPLGAPLPGTIDEATRALATTALDERFSGHAGVVSVSPFHEDLALVHGGNVARSGTMTVYVFELADGTYHAAGVCCGVAGCEAWPTYEPAQ